MNYVKFFLTIVLLFGITSCSREGGDVKNSAGSVVINIVATTGMITDIAQVVGGEHVKGRDFAGKSVIEEFIA